MTAPNGPGKQIGVWGQQAVALGFCAGGLWSREPPVGVWTG